MSWLKQLRIWAFGPFKSDYVIEDEVWETFNVIATVQVWNHQTKTVDHFTRTFESWVRDGNKPICVDSTGIFGGDFELNIRRYEAIDYFRNWLKDPILNMDNGVYIPREQISLITITKPQVKLIQKVYCYYPSPK